MIWMLLFEFNHLATLDLEILSRYELDGKPLSHKCVLVNATCTPAASTANTVCSRLSYNSARFFSPSSI